MKTIKLSDVASTLTAEEMKVLRETFGETIPVSNDKRAETLAKAILADMQNEQQEVQ
jgi:hypothetical protein